MARGSVRRRGWVWAGFVLGFAGQSLGAGVLFWAVFPVWLCCFWTVQGYPPAVSDLPLWFAVGAFNAAPIVGVVVSSPIVLLTLLYAHRRCSADAKKRLLLLSALLYALLVPPVAYALLLVYAEMWHYRAWDAMMPSLLRAYLMLAPACALVGALVGWLWHRWRARS
ncbi:MAG: hypothetical protein NZ874_04375 [Fimbriimonadales bacterium]|nr:hypothetical protein [Fimbriimonadales bacterium]